MTRTNRRIWEWAKLSAGSVAVLGTAVLLFFMTFRQESQKAGGRVREIHDDLLDLTVDDSGDLWAVGHHGRILHSPDGGQTWTFQSSGVTTPLSSVAFRNRDVGVAVGYNGVVLRTTNGGAEWRLVSSGVDLYLTTVRLGPGTKVFAAGELGTIVLSEDDGATWHVLSSGEHDFIINDLDFSENGEGWAVGELGKALWSPDGGKTWSPRVITENLLAKEVSLSSIDLISASSIWVSGMDSTLVHSTDGGRSWEEIVAPCEKTQLLRVRFAKERGYAVGRRCIVVTDDGGRSWRLSSLDPRIRYSWLYGLHLTPDSVWVAGYRESLFHAGADDANWIQVYVDRESEQAPRRFGAKVVAAIDSTT